MVLAWEGFRVCAPRGDIMAMDSSDLAMACAKAADEIQAENIRVWDMRGVSNLTDFMVVCSGSSMPHLRAVLRDVAGLVEEWHGVKPVHTEGKADTRWVVLDYIDVMVHVMHVELRDFYGLEELWADAKEVVWKA
jgi:ribosome-associated protein